MPTILQVAHSTATVTSGNSVSLGSVSVPLSPTQLGTTLVLVASSNTENSSNIVGMASPPSPTGWDAEPLLYSTFLDMPAGVQAGIWHFPNNPGGMTSSGALNVDNGSGHDALILITVYEIEGVIGTVDAGASSANHVATTHPVGGSVTTTLPDDFLLAVFGVYNDFSATVTYDWTATGGEAENSDGTISHFGEYETLASPGTTQAAPTLSSSAGYFSFTLALTTTVPAPIHTTLTPSTSFGTPTVGHADLYTTLSPSTSMAAVQFPPPRFFHAVQKVTADWFLNGTSVALSVGSTGAGNILVMMVSSPNGGIRTFTWPSGWSSPVRLLTVNGTMEAAYYVNNPGSITSVTIGGVNNTADTHVCFLEFASRDNAGTFDSSATNIGSTQAETNSVTLSSSLEELVVAFTSVYSYRETGTPSFDHGFDDGFLIAADPPIGGSSYAEYNTAALVGTTSISPSSATGGEQWGAINLSFLLGTLNEAVSTEPTPSTTMNALRRVHTASIATQPSPATSMATSHSFARSMVTQPNVRTRFDAGGYSPRTVPMSAVFAIPTRIIPMVGVFVVFIPTRTIPMSAVFSRPAYQRIIPQGVCFGFRTVPMKAVLLEPDIQRTIPQDAQLYPFGRVISMAGTFVTTLSAKRTIPQIGIFGVFTRKVPMAATFILTTAGQRVIPETVVLQAIVGNIQRIIPERAVFQTQQANVQRVVPMDSTFVASPHRTVPMMANLLKARVIPMTVQSPLIGFRHIPMTIAASATYERTIIHFVIFGVVGAQRVVPQDALFGISAERVIPQDATLDFIITYERIIPETAILEATDTRTIPERALLGGPTHSWVICKPAVGVNVCSGMATV